VIMKDETLDRFLKFGSAIYLALTIVGVFKQAIYYQIFGLNIFDYIQISEVLTLSINNLTLYTTALAVVVAVLFILNSSTNKQEEDALLAIYELPIWRHIGFTNRLSWAMFLCLAYFSGIFLFFRKTHNYWAILGIDIACIVFYLYLVAVIEIGRAYYYNKKEIHASRVTLAQFLGMFLFFIIVFTTHQALNIKSAKHKAADVELYKEDSTSPIQGNYLFIGKTDKYIFVYDYKLQSTIIYSSDFVKKIHFVQQ
jgi:hypothetical protein